MFYVYILKSEKDGDIYVGYSSDLKRRLEEHNNGEETATHFKAPFQLVYYEAYRKRADAIHREKQLKRHAGAMTQLKKRLTASLL